MTPFNKIQYVFFIYLVLFKYNFNAETFLDFACKLNYNSHSENTLKP